MSFRQMMDMRKALKLHKDEQLDAALEMYEKLFDDGYMRAAYLLPYSTLLMRKGGEARFLKAKEVLKAAEKAPDLAKDKKQMVHTNYAVAMYKLGDTEKALKLLEASHQSAPCGLTYQTLGYLYVDAGIQDKALEFNKAALDYDDEDPICLDNMGQTYYRLLDDKQTAKQYFDKAYEIKDSQIDTLYFLARYDIEKGDISEAEEKLKTALKGRFSPLNYVTPEKIKELMKQNGIA